MTERRKNQSEEWTYFTLLFTYFITVNMQIIGIGNKKIHIGPSLQKIYILVPPQVIIFFFSLESAASWGHKQGNTLDALIVHCIATNCQVVKTKKICAIL